MELKQLNTNKTRFGMPAFEPEREERFQREYLRHCLPLLRLTIPMGMAPYMIFFIWDFAQEGYNPILTFSIRMGYVLILAVVLASTFTDFFRRRSQAIMCCTASMSAFGIALVLFSLPNGFALGYGGICFAMMYGCSLLFLQFVPSFVFVAFVLASTNVLILSTQHNYDVNFILLNTNFFLVSFAIGGTVFAYVTEHGFRSKFAETGAFASPWLFFSPDGDKASNSSARVKAFICYRREDTQDVVGRITDRVKTTFGNGSVLQDVEIVPLGADYRTYLGRVIKQCDSMLVFIGRDWLTSVQKRSDHAHDPVVTEIELALNLGLTIIPVLLQGATIPDEEDLPKRISAISFLNAATIRPDPDFDSDVAKLIQALES